MLVWLIVPFMIFAVFDPSPLTVCKLQFFISSVKKKVRGKLGKLLQKYLTSSAVCGHLLLKHFSCRCFRMMRTTNDLRMPVLCDISRSVLWVRGWSSWVRTISLICMVSVLFRAGTSRSVAALTSVHCAHVSELLEQPVNATYRPCYVRKFCPQLSVWKATSAVSSAIQLTDKKWIRWL